MESFIDTAIAIGGHGKLGGAGQDDLPLLCQGRQLPLHTPSNHLKACLADCLAGQSCSTPGRRAEVGA